MVSEIISSSGSLIGYLGGHKKVVIDGVCSDPAPVLPGVQQGSVLGPILFLIFINDLPDKINSTVRLFADDFVLYRNIKRVEDQQILQHDLNKLASWKGAWLMKFSVAKCNKAQPPPLPSPPPHHHHFHPRPDTHSLKQIIHDYSLHNQVLENVSSAKYLGITVTDDQDWVSTN